MSNKCYFLGCPTPTGFETRFGDEIRSGKYFTHIIKGGPGTGKSTLMKRLAEKLSDVDTAELYYCSSDPASLDAVLFPRLGVILVDGTAPHVFEPTYPGARERLLDLGRFWDHNKLRARAKEIIRYSDENGRLHQRAKRYLAAVCSLSGEIMSNGEAALLKDKLDAYVGRLGAKLLPKNGRTAGSISLKQITSITPNGVITQESALDECEKYVIDDPYFAVTDRLLKEFSTLAAAHGYDVIASKNVFHYGCVYEHVVIPELKLALVSGSSAADGHKINALRFYDHDKLRDGRRKFVFNQSARREFILASADALSAAKAVHDDLERCYIEAMDFDAIAELTEKIAKDLRER